MTRWGTTEGVPADAALTVIDFIARLESFGDVDSLAKYAGTLPAKDVQDERFAKAFKRRLDAIKEHQHRRTA